MKGFQFSLRMMLAAVAVVGIGAGLLVAEPSWQVGAIEAVLTAWVPASAVILAVHREGTRKAWWIGIVAGCVLVEFGFYSYMIPQALHLSIDARLQYWACRISEHFYLLLVGWAFAPVVGLLCVFTHRFFIRPPEPKA